MCTINTSLGTLHPKNLGRVDSHEHVIIKKFLIDGLYPDFLHENINLIARELVEWKDAGGGVLIDCSPIGAGRAPEYIVDLSDWKKIPIILSTGLHKQGYYPDDHWIHSIDVNSLSDIFLDELQIGIMRDEHNPASTQRFSVKAGVLKIAVEKEWFSGFTKKVFAAAVKTINLAHIPLIIHTNTETPLLQVVNWLSDRVFDMAKIVFCHMDKCQNVSILNYIVEKGAFIEFDSMTRKTLSISQLVEKIVNLRSDRILFGGDLARKSYWKCYGGSPGLAFLLTDLTGQLIQAGLKPSVIDKIWIENPQTLFS